MTTINSIAELEALYEIANPLAIKKCVTQITPHYRTWIEAANFVLLSTAGNAGTDCSPRGDTGPVVRIADPQTILLPDWKGNNRLDSLRNIVTDGRASLLFMIPGALNVVRVNGSAALSVDPALTTSFDKTGKHPRTVIVLHVAELYFQCAKALMRSNLWGDNPELPLPSAGDFLKEVDRGFDGETYDLTYESNAKQKFW